MAWLANSLSGSLFGGFSRRPSLPGTGFAATAIIGLSLAIAAHPAGAQTNLLGDDMEAGANQPGQNQNSQNQGGPKSLLPSDGGGDAATGAFILPSRIAAAETPATDTDDDSEDDPFSDDRPAVAPDRPKPADPLELLAGPTGDPGHLGLLSDRGIGYDADLFAGSDARFLAAFLTRIEAPLGSRWMQIMLQRALLSTTTAPAGLDPADWVAARGSALLAMGSAADAHRLVSAVAINRYTEHLYQVAADAALASGDPLAVCPLSPTARARTGQPLWTLLDAMCLSILGDDLSATALFDQLRRRQQIDNFDIGLAERVGSTIGGGRRGTNPAWQEIDRLSAWRIGMAAATGLDLPDNLLAGSTPAERGWYVRLAGVSAEQRAGFVADAAATGAISSAEANRLLASASAAIIDRKQAAASPGGQIRTANAATNQAERLNALKSLWARAEAGSPAHYGWQVTTALAAARIRPVAALAEDAPAIVQSLAAAGIDTPLSGWWRVMQAADAGHRAGVWAAAVALVPDMPLEAGLFDNWAKTVSAHRRDLLAAGLDGLGRGRIGGDIPTLDNVWTQALEEAARDGRKGEAMLLAASALRGSWAEVPPDYLRRIARAFTALGLDEEARLIVAEAATRG